MKLASKRFGWLVGAGLWLGGCTMANPDFQGDPELAGECRIGLEVSESFESFERPEKVDLLFVVSQTSEMRLFQFGLGEALPGFLEGLEAEGFDLRVAVQTADRSQAGELAPVIQSVADSAFEDCSQNQNGVAKSGEEGWLRTARCNVVQGTEGDRRLRPLEVLQHSLVEAPEALEEFRRPDAKLVVVIFSNEDDCSGPETLRFADQGTVRDRCVWQADELSDVQAWAREVQATAKIPEGLSLVVVSGPTTVVEYPRPEVVRPVCRSTPGSSYPSQRLVEAAQAFGEQGLFLSSCVLDFHAHLETIAAEVIRSGAGTFCPSESMSQEPLDVRGVYSDGERSLRFGRDYVFLGATESCENGAIEVRRSGLEGAEQIELLYCAD